MCSACQVLRIFGYELSRLGPGSKLICMKLITCELHFDLFPIQVSPLPMHPQLVRVELDPLEHYVPWAN